MVLFNYSTRELTAKIVYYGPGLCGKTTNLQYIHENLSDDVKGKMLSLATKTDRTLFFDFLPIDLGEIRGMKTRVQLYTVPGQVFYNETRKLVLKGADGIVFVADSQEQMLGANVESFKNLEENLRAHGMKLSEMPHVIQFNKRDLPKLSGIEDLNAALNRFNAPFYESIATTGIGVQDTLKAIVKLVLLHLTRKYDPKAVAPAAERPQPPVAAVAVKPAPPVVKATPPAARPTPVAVPAPAPRAAAPPPADRGEQRPTSIPLSPIEEPRTSRPATVPAAAAVRRSGAAAASVAPSFAESEIDQLVDEVEEIYEAAALPVSETPWESAAPAAPTSVPPRSAKATSESFYAQEAAVAATPSPEDPGSTWMGSPDEGEAVSGSPFAEADAAFGSTLSLDDFEKASGSIAEAPAPGASVLDEPVLEPPLDWTPSAPEAPFVVDRGFDPEWGSADARDARPHAPVSQPPRESAEAPASEASRFDAADTVVFQEEDADYSHPEDELVEPQVADLPPVLVESPFAAAKGAQDAEVELREVAREDDLFRDPNLDVARLEPGEACEILVPVQLGDGPDARRFRLAIRLRLDSVS